MRVMQRQPNAFNQGAFVDRESEGAGSRDGGALRLSGAARSASRSRKGQAHKTLMRYSATSVRR
jgi:hypothetical protein